jgi:hypothetical protein
MSVGQWKKYDKFNGVNILENQKLIVRYSNGELGEVSSLDTHRLTSSVTEYLVTEKPNKTYYVNVMQRWSQTIKVEAQTPHDAIMAIRHGKGEEIDNMFEMRDTMDSGTWEVELM